MLQGIHGLSGRSKWKSVFSDPLLSLSRLRAAALSKDGLGESDVDGGIALRSVYWRVSPPISVFTATANLSSTLVFSHLQLPLNSSLPPFLPRD